MHGVAPQMCQSGSPSIVRRRSRGSLPRLHLRLNDFWQFTPRSWPLFACATRPRDLAARVCPGGNGDRLVRLANGGRLVDGGRRRQRSTFCRRHASSNSRQTFRGWTPIVQTAAQSQRLAVTLDAAVAAAERIGASGDGKGNETVRHSLEVREAAPHYRQSLKGREAARRYRQSLKGEKRCGVTSLLGLNWPG